MNICLSQSFWAAGKTGISTYFCGFSHVLNFVLIFAYEVLSVNKLGVVLHYEARTKIRMHLFPIRFMYGLCGFHFRV